jgi:hypothetical protein
MAAFRVTQPGSHIGGSPKNELHLRVDVLSKLTTSFADQIIMISAGQVHDVEYVDIIFI